LRLFSCKKAVVSISNGRDSHRERHRYQFISQMIYGRNQGISVSFTASKKRPATAGRFSVLAAKKT
jgi:hypothetical protein